jgi:hypothetical protein
VTVQPAGSGRPHGRTCAWGRMEIGVVENRMKLLPAAVAGHARGGQAGCACERVGSWTMLLRARRPRRRAALLS